MASSQGSDSGSGKSRTRLEPEQRHAEILDAAERLFRDSDYHEVFLDQIAEEAGVTRGLLHHYFGSKRALYLLVVERAVRIPASTPILPSGATGDLREVISQSVESWLDLIEAAGGLWLGSGGSVGLVETDVDHVIIEARDELVERMIEELPFTADIDTDMLRAALRSFSAFSRAAAQEWLDTKTLSRSQTAALLRTTLISLVETSVPAMTETGTAEG